MIQSKIYFYISILFSGLLWCNTGCSKNTEEPTETTVVIRNQEDNTSAPVNVKQNNQTIEACLTEFSTLLKSEDWNGLADITDFPLIIRGELDDEGSVELDRKKFVRFINEFFKEEVYLNINDELVAFTYRDLMIKPIDKPQVASDIMELHGFQFINKNQRWKLKQITTYAHIVEKYIELKNE